MLLSVKNLSIGFVSDSHLIQVVENISFDIDYGEFFALVGESGCGKSVTALSLLRLVDFHGGKITSGEILFDGQSLLDLSNEDIRSIRGRELAMIFQDPFHSLNPSYTIYEQMREVFQVHLRTSKEKVEKECLRLLERVHLPHPKQCLKKYPHELSGGMLQRVMIAIALICKPKLLIADEPTTALDVTIQAEILELLREIQVEENMAVLLITHDLSIVRDVSRRMAVMYAGKIVEQGNTRGLFNNPLHPYSQGLMNCIKSLHGEKQVEDKKIIQFLKTGNLKLLNQAVKQKEQTKEESEIPKNRLTYIPGTVPDPSEKPSGCFFHPRCKKKKDVCAKKYPLEKNLKGERRVSCILYS